MDTSNLTVGEQGAFEWFYQSAQLAARIRATEKAREATSGAAKGKLTRKIKEMENRRAGVKTIIERTGWLQPINPAYVLEAMAYTVKSARKAHDKATKAICDHAMAEHEADFVGQAFRAYVAANCMMRLLSEVQWALTGGNEGEEMEPVDRALLALAMMSKALENAKKKLLDGSSPKSTDWFDLPVDCVERETLGRFIRHEGRESDRYIRRGWQDGLEAWKAMAATGIPADALAQIATV